MKSVKSNIENDEGINIKCTYYGGEFGPDNLRTDIYVSEMYVTKVASECHKELIFVIDVSGSMLGERIETVKRGLLTAYEMLKKNTSITIITFNDKAHLSWDNTFYMSYEDCVDNITISGSTNIEDGLRMALKIVKEKQVKSADPIWIICMTDGESNLGQLSSIYFDDMYKKYGSNVKIITVGIGEQFSDTLLKGANQMTHVKSLDTIYDVMGSVISDITSIVGYNASITFEETGDSVYAVGNSNIGFIQQAQRYVQIYMPNPHSEEGCLINSSIFNCNNPETGKPYTQIIPVSHADGKLPDHYVEMYFQARTAKIMEDINSRLMNSYKSRLIKEEINLWNVQVSIPFKSMVTETLNKWSDGLLVDQDRYNSTCVNQCVINQKTYGTKNVGAIDIESTIGLNQSAITSIFKDIVKTK